MLQKPLVKSAFHLSWFLLILGGTSLFEKKLWGVAGGAMLLYGLIVLAYTAFAIYLHKPFLKQPALVLLITLGFVTLLIIAHLAFGHYILSMILAALAVPVLAGWITVRRETSNPRSTAKKKSR
jgi:hypothetical protein